LLHKREMSCYLIIYVVDLIAAITLYYKLRLIIKANNSFRILVYEQNVISVMSNETLLHTQLKRTIVYRMPAWTRINYDDRRLSVDTIKDAYSLIALRQSLLRLVAVIGSLTHLRYCQSMLLVPDDQNAFVTRC